MRLYATLLLVWASLVMAAANTKPMELGEKNWRLMLQGEWMVQFVAPWCTSCRNVAHIWENYANTARKHGVRVAVVDITKSPALSGRFLVTSLPTIYHVNDGKFRYYYGKRDNEALHNYIKLKQWKNTVPVSGWTNPNSMHMAALSYFFRLSFMLKEWNALLQDEYGLSAYGSYGVLVLGTIFIGGILALLLVVFIDCVSTSKKNKKRREFKEINKSTITVDKTQSMTLQEDIEELVEEDEQIVDMSAMNVDEENSSETEKQDEHMETDELDYEDDDNDDEDNVSLYEDEIDYNNNENDDNETDNEVEENNDNVTRNNDLNSTFVMPKNIEIIPDIYEDESDEDIYHNCKLITSVPTEGTKNYRKTVNATI